VESRVNAVTRTQIQVTIATRARPPTARLGAGCDSIGPCPRGPVRRLQAMEIPCCRSACASRRSSSPAGARARFATPVHQGRNARAGCRSGADELLEHPLVRAPAAEAMSHAINTSPPPAISAPRRATVTTTTCCPLSALSAESSAAPARRRIGPGCGRSPPSWLRRGCRRMASP
jgi:hypothetical protein